MNFRLLILLIPLFFSCILNNDDPDSYKFRFFCNGMPEQINNNTGSAPLPVGLALIGNNNYIYDTKTYIGKTRDGVSYMYCVISEEIYKDVQYIDVSVAKGGDIYIDIQKNNKTIIIVADSLATAGSHSYKIDKM